MSRVAYYPGCSLHGTAKELDSSFIGTAARLGVDLVGISEDEREGGSVSGTSLSA